MYYTRYQISLLCLRNACDNVLLVGRILSFRWRLQTQWNSENLVRRVRDCPISEAAISVCSSRCSHMTGLRPIVDMTFMDFCYCHGCCPTKLLRLATCLVGKVKYQWPFAVLLVTELDLQLNTPNPLESWFTHIPGLKVVALNSSERSMKGLLKSSIDNSNHSWYKSNSMREVPVDPDYTIPLGVGEIKREGTSLS